MRLRKLLPLLLVAANLLATTAFVPCSLFRTRSASLCATQEERELAMAEYFRNNNEETLQAILQVSTAASAL